MILNHDLIREIALHTDYQTTLNLLQICSYLNTKDFWKNKTYLLISLDVKTFC